MVLDYWSLIRANVSDSEHNQTHAIRHSYDLRYALAAYAVDVECCLVLDVFIS